MANTDVSRLLGEIWRNASPEEKEPFVQQELKERAIYKEDIQKFREKQAASEATNRSIHQSMVQGFHRNQQHLHHPAPQKSLAGMERLTIGSPENAAIDPFAEHGGGSNESSAFRPHVSGQFQRSVYFQPDFYSPDGYPQATWSGLSMDDSDPLPLASQRLSHHSQFQPTTGEELNPNNAYYSSRSNYFPDGAFPRYP